MSGYNISCMFWFGTIDEFEKWQIHKLGNDFKGVEKFYLVETQELNVYMWSRNINCFVPSVKSSPSQISKMKSLMKICPYKNFTELLVEKPKFRLVKG